MKALNGQRTSTYHYYFGEGPDVERMREAVADEIWCAFGE